MADYRSNDGCYRHDMSDPACENHVHKADFATAVVPVIADFFPSQPEVTRFATQVFQHVKATHNFLASWLANGQT